MGSNKCFVIGLIIRDEFRGFTPSCVDHFCTVPLIRSEIGHNSGPFCLFNKTHFGHYFIDSPYNLFIDLRHGLLLQQFTGEV